jgi:GAF domain-containing protein
MSSLLGLDDLLTRAVEAGVYVTGAEQAIVHLIDRETGRLVVGAEQGQGGVGPADFAARVEEVIQSGSATIVEVASEDLTAGPESKESISSILVVPLKIRGDAIGAVSVRKTRSDDSHANNDKYLLSVLANYIAIGVENARLYDNLQRRVEQLALLNEVGQALSSTVDLEQTLKLVMERINHMLKVEAGSLLLVDEESSELVFQIALGEQSEHVKPLRIKVGQGIAGQVAESGQPLLIPDLQRETGSVTAIDISTDFLARSALCVPMLARGQTIGVIEVINKLEGTFTEDDLSVLNAIANYAAVAIDNARLFRGFGTSSSQRLDTDE